MKKFHSLIVVETVVLGIRVHVKESATAGADPIKIFQHKMILFAGIQPISQRSVKVYSKMFSVVLLLRSL